MAIPAKRYERNTLSYLDPGEIKALLAAPDRSTWLGRRDHALLVVMIQTGVRVSELAGLRISDVHLGAGAHIRILGKGRKKRATTLTSETVKVVRQWLTERRGEPVGFQNSATASDLVFYAARSYSLMRPPRTGQRLIRCWERSATGWSGRGVWSWRLRWGRRPL
jgi:site-specific recombinase XerD